MTCWADWLARAKIDCAAGLSTWFLARLVDSCANPYPGSGSARPAGWHCSTTGSSPPRPNGPARHQCWRDRGGTVHPDTSANLTTAFGMKENSLHRRHGYAGPSPTKGAIERIAQSASIHMNKDTFLCHLRQLYRRNWCANPGIGFARIALQAKQYCRNWFRLTVSVTASSVNGSLCKF